MKYLLAIALSFAGLATWGQKGPTAYKVYDVKTQKETELAQIVKGLSEGQVLIFGEQHDDSIGHRLELSLLQQMQQRFGNKVVLTMEMFERDIQPVIDEYLADIISEKNFRKEARSWNNYDDYKPMVEFAKTNKLPVIAANAPARYTNLVTRKGLGALEQLSKETKKQYIAPLPVDTLTGLYYEKFLEVMGGHTVPGMNLYQSQNFWDATMAFSIDEAMKKNKGATVFQVNGRFHSDFHSGLGERLRNNYKRSVTTISCFAAENFDQPDWKAYAPQADYIILTMPVPEKAAE